MKINTVTIDKVKDAIIKGIVNDLASTGDMNSEQIKAKKEELEQQIKSKQLITTLRESNGLTSSKDFNSTIQELYIDILTTFGYINSLDENISNHIEINQSTINNLKSLINVANDRLDAFEDSLSAKSNPYYYIEGFRNSDSFEEDSSLYTERYGEVVPMSCKVNFNPHEELVHLSYLRNENMMTYKNGVSLGTISIKKQVGSGFIKLKSDANSLGNAIDTSYQTYWGESILCDEPLRVGFSSVRPTEPKDLENYYYGIQHGAMCELEINFEAVSMINELTFVPYGKYPIEIIAIRYKGSDDPEEPVKEIVSPDQKFDAFRGKTIVSPASFKFQDTVCKRLYVLFNQIHYTKSTYIYSTNEVFKNDLWFNVTNYDEIKPKIKDDVLFAPNYLDKAFKDNAWTYINNTITQNKNVDLKSILFANEDKKLAETKYQYTYGFYNIAPNLNEFEKTGVYVSKFISANGNIKSVRITSEEEHPVDNENGRWTDIEYYITYKENPDYSDWMPILPTNKEYIEKELLQTAGYVCVLRFPTLEIQDVYCNDIPLMQDVEYTKLLNEKNQIYALDIIGFDQYAKYTVSYKPVTGSDTIFLNDENNQTIVSTYEMLQGANESYYELSDYPYMSLTHNKPTDIRLINKDTGVVQTQVNGDIVCVTELQNTNESFKGFDKLTNKIQYYTDRNYLYFNQNIPSNITIEINYDHYVSKVRLKAILRRNAVKNAWISPSLTKIKYEFVTAD